MHYIYTEWLLVTLTLYNSYAPRNSTLYNSYVPRNSTLNIALRFCTRNLKHLQELTKMKSGQAEIVETSKAIQKSGLMSRRNAILEFILRIVAFFNTITSAILMATTNETLPFFAQFIRFHAEYSDLPALTYKTLNLLDSFTCLW